MISPKKRPRKNQRLIRVGIIDDEISCIETLETLLTDYFPEYRIVLTESDPEKAKVQLEESSLDLLFLDVQLGKITGFDLLGGLDQKTRVVFTTGYDQYAVRAFEVNALDYILKPVEFDRLKRALQIFSDKKIQSRTLPLIQSDDDILLREDNLARLVPLNKIKYIVSDKDYTKVYTDNKMWYMRRTLIAWEEKLPASIFIRIHRSIMINMERVVSVQKKTTGIYELTVDEIDEPIVSSRRYGNRIKQFLDNN